MVAQPKKGLANVFKQYQIFLNIHKFVYTIGYYQKLTPIVLSVK